MKDSKSKIVIIIIALLMISNHANAEYTYYYDKELHELTILDPEKTILLAKQKLIDAELELDTGQQLIALYYLAEAYSILSDNNTVDVYTSKGLKLSEEIKNNIFKAEFLSYSAYSKEIKGEFRSALDDVELAYNLTKEIDDDRLAGDVIGLRGQIHLALENFDLALEDVQKAIDIFKENKDRERTGLYYNLLALIYGALDNPKKSIQYLKESMEYDDIKSPYNMAIYHYNIGLTYMQIKEYDQAIEHLGNSREISKEINDLNTLAFVDYGLAEVYLRKNEIEKAEKSLANTLLEFKSNNEVIMQFNVHILMADIKVKQKLYDKALLHINLAEKFLNQLDTPNNKLTFLAAKIEYFKSQNMWKQAYKLRIQYNDISKNINKDSKNTIIEELKVKYDAEYDEEEMAYLEQVILQEKGKQKYFLGLILFASISILLAFLLFQNQKKIKQNVRRLAIESELAQIPGRRKTLKLLKNSLKNSQISKTDFSVVMLDLDHLNKINEEFGHATGNEVLIHFMHSLKQVLSEQGSVGRLGGKEWLIILSETDLEEVKVILYTLRKKYNQPALINLPDSLDLHFSCGMVYCKNQFEKIGGILKVVDDAMIKAKSSGRNQDIIG